MSRFLFTKFTNLTQPMAYLSLFILAIALAADAFSVAASIGLSHNHPRQLFRLSFHFGLFQSLFALAGVLIGTTLLHFVEGIDHWVAFTLLTLLGGFMIYKSLKMEEGQQLSFDFTRGIHLIGLSTAVSIDAFAAGVGLPAMQVSVFISVPVIGIVSTLATFIAMELADHIKKRWGKQIEIVAGSVLILLGCSILFHHLVYQ